MLCAVPALRALRAAAPRAHIALVGLPWAQAFAARFLCYIDEFIEFPGYPGFPLPERPDARAIAAFLGGMQRRRFDLAIQMHGSGVTSNPFTAMLGARATAGAWLPDHYCPDPARFVFYDNEAPEVHRNLKIVERLGAPPRGAALEFPLFEQDWEELRPAMHAHGLRTGEYACVHPGARVPARRWPAERFAVVADALAGAGVRIVFTGSAAERPLIATIRRLMKNASADLTGLAFGAMAALVSEARLLVANDTGISHLASAFHVPSVVVFTAGDPRRWAPPDGARHLQVHVPADCRPCDYDVCPIGHPCALGVSVDAVLKSARQLMPEELACAS
jgi:ADP-heptose:LPS heptosyltransferase